MSNEIDQFIANNPNVSRETIAKLTDFRSFLIEQNSKHNLVSKSQLDKIWMRHIHDSLRIFYLLDLKKSSQILDIGSGGGFPAIPMAVASEKYDFKYFTDFSYLEYRSRCRSGFNPFTYTCNFSSICVNINMSE